MGTMTNVAQIRKRLGLSQSEMAERLAVDQSTVSNWETGRNEPLGPALILLKQLESEANQNHERAE